MLAGRTTTTKTTRFLRGLLLLPNSRPRTSRTIRVPVSRLGSVAGPLISATTAKTSPFSSRPATACLPYLASPLPRQHRLRRGPNPTGLETCKTPSSRAAFTMTPTKMSPSCRPASVPERVRPKTGAIKGKTGDRPLQARQLSAVLAPNQALVEDSTRSFKGSLERSSMASIRGRTHKQVCQSGKGTEITPCTTHTGAALAVDQALQQVRGLERHCLRVKSRRGNIRKR